MSKFTPSIPKNWKPDKRKVNKQKPELNSVDNPGGWSQFIFRPEFDSATKGGNYKGHFFPTSAMTAPVSSDVDGIDERSINGWKFHYKGWSCSTSNFRLYAITENLYPDKRIGCLDKDLLLKMGLTKERMIHGGALFFYQLLLPFCNPKKLGIKDDPCTAFYSKVTNFSNQYACSIGLVGGQYLHAFKIN